MTGKHLEIISQIVLWYKDSFRIGFGHRKDGVIILSVEGHQSTCHRHCFY